MGMLHPCQYHLQLVSETRDSSTLFPSTVATRVCSACRSDFELLLPFSRAVTRAWSASSSCFTALKLLLRLAAVSTSPEVKPWGRLKAATASAGTSTAPRTHRTRTDGARFMPPP